MFIIIYFLSSLYNCLLKSISLIILLGEVQSHLRGTSPRPPPLESGLELTSFKWIMLFRLRVITALLNSV